jgi:hypothetical protein
VTPNTGSIAGGTHVRGVGSGFQSVTITSITLGGVPVPWFAVIDDATLAMITPQSDALGPATAVIYSGGSGTSAAGVFSYVSPGGGVPMPDRGRWRLALHQRVFSDTPGSTLIADLFDARSRQLTQAWDSPAELTFTLDGETTSAQLVSELTTDVRAYRWDEQSGNDVEMFRGIVDHSEDQLSEDSAVVTFTCHDYAAMLSRRIVTSTLSVTATDQDNLAISLANTAKTAPFTPGSYLPIWPELVNPDGTQRSANSGQLRDRTYLGQTNIGTAFDELAKVINGFDYDVVPQQLANINLAPQSDTSILRIFYPMQGVTRTDMALVYGANVAALTRTVSSDTYGNYWRVLGNNQSSDATVPQWASVASNSDANNVTVNPIGTWMSGDNAADVTIQSTLDQQAQGDLNLSGLLVPTYTLTLAPGAYRYGSPKMGDTVPLVVEKGRLHVDTTLRVMGITYAIGEDGDEDVSLVLGRSPLSLYNLVTAGSADINALTRR